jgi:hypothetical protein
MHDEILFFILVITGNDLSNHVIELYHKFVVPWLNKIKFSERTGIVTFVGAIVFFVFVWFQTFLTALEHIHS